MTEMQRITTFHQAKKALEAFIPRQTPSRYNLDQIKALMNFLGQPQNRLRIIHIAGTSGKTSTSYYAAALLTASGAKTGLTVSPHIDEINERLQLNLVPLNEAEYCRAVTEFLDLVGRSRLQPSYFELLVALAYWYFDRAGVDYAVVEVGLGGLLDGTNVIDRADKVCLITDIGLDHTHILGNSLEAISRQKAGIILPGNQVFMHRQPEPVGTVIKSICAQQGARLTTLPPVKSAGDLPPFQERNWQLAKAAVDYVLTRDGRQYSNRQAVQASRLTSIPGRMEVVMAGSKTVILDGSHNSQKIGALVAAMKRQYAGRPIDLLISFGENKAETVADSLTLLRTLSPRVTVTGFSFAQDEIRRPLAPQTLAAICRSTGFSQVSLQPQPAVALKAALEQATDILLITGSFYLLNHVRRQLLVQ